MEESKRRLEDLQEAAKQKALDAEVKPTFKPEIKATGPKRTQEEFEKYMNDWNSHKEHTLKEKRETKEATLKASNSFRPTINKNSLKLAVKRNKNRLVMNKPEN